VYFGKDDTKAVNWCGFYIDSCLFPLLPGTKPSPDSAKLLLGPFCGKPAYADIQRQTLLVPDVDAYPGHIGCDGDTKSEIVCPLIVSRDGGMEEVVGVLDLDCLAIAGFDAEDKVGLENISRLVVNVCDW